MELILFWVFSALMLLCAMLVLVNRDPVNSAMYLILLFLCMAGLFLLLHAFFIAVIQVLVYAGAVMVLFLFVIMLLDLDIPKRRVAQLGTAIGAILVLASIGGILAKILGKPDVLGPNAIAAGDAPGSLKDVVIPLFKDYIVPLQLIGLIMLTSIVGVVLISKKEIK